MQTHASDSRTMMRVMTCPESVENSTPIQRVANGAGEENRSGDADDGRSLERGGDGGGGIRNDRDVRFAAEACLQFTDLLGQLSFRNRARRGRVRHNHR